MSVLQPLIDRLKILFQEPDVNFGEDRFALTRIMDELQIIDNLQGQNFDMASLKIQRDQAIEDTRAMAKRLQEMTDKNTQLQRMVDAAVSGKVPEAADQSGEIEALKKQLEATEDRVEEFQTERKNLKRFKLQWDSACDTADKWFSDESPDDLELTMEDSTGNCLVDYLVTMHDEIVRLRNDPYLTHDYMKAAIAVAQKWFAADRFATLIELGDNILTDGIEAMGNEILRLRGGKDDLLDKIRSEIRTLRELNDSLERELAQLNRSVEEKDREITGLVAQYESLEGVAEDKGKQIGRLAAERHHILATVKHWVGAGSIFGTVPGSDGGVSEVIDVLGNQIVSLKGELKAKTDLLQKTAPPQFQAGGIIPNQQAAVELADPLRLKLWNEAEKAVKGMNDHLGAWDAHHERYHIELLKFQASLLPEPQKGPQ